MQPVSTCVENAPAFTAHNLGSSFAFVVPWLEHTFGRHGHEFYLDSCHDAIAPCQPDVKEGFSGRFVSPEHAGESLEAVVDNQLFSGSQLDNTAGNHGGNFEQITDIWRHPSPGGPSQYPLVTIYGDPHVVSIWFSLVAGSVPRHQFSKS